MQSHTERIYQLALQRVPYIGWSTANNLINHFGSVEDIFKAHFKELISVRGISARCAKEIVAFQDFDPFYRELEFMEKHDVHFHFFTDSQYPIRLKANSDAPLGLFTKGCGSIESSRMIGIVGTRKNSIEAVELCEELVAGLAAHNPTILSGLAYGVDALAHELAIQNNLRTSAVLAHGLDRMYPFKHRSLATKILDSNGMLITENMTGEIPNRQNFPRRNRIVAGLVDALIVVQSPVAGGSMITADMAFGYNREVMAFPGSVRDELFKGCHLLIKSNKAHLIESSEDVVRILNYDLSVQKNAQRSLLLDLRDDQLEIIHLLRANGVMEIDSIVRATEKSPSKISELLFELEINDHIRSLPGKSYKLK